MRQIIVLLATVLMLAACKSPVSNTTSTSENSNIPYQSGDLLFVSLPLNFGLSLPPDSVSLIMSQTDTPTQCIHVAIIEREDDSVFVIDATIKHGVARYPLDEFLADFTLSNGGLPILQLMRLADSSDGTLFVSNAKKYIGQPYDIDFNLGNDAQYCSELVRNAYVTPSGDTLFPTLPIDFTEGHGTLSRYWNNIFGLLKCQSPQGKPGLLPSDIKNDSRLHTVTMITSAE